MINPIWISINNGDGFEGHQGHFANCYFSNATESTIRYTLENRLDVFDEITCFEIREMTNEEVTKYPEVLEIRDMLINEYGEA